MKIAKKEENKIKRGEFGEIVNWLQRIELNIESLEKRLDAVERRISDEEFEGVKFGEEKTGEWKSENEEIPFLSLRKKEEEKSANYEEKIRGIEERLKKIEGKTIVKIRGIEFPIEVTGIVGGILAFMIAILLNFGWKETIISPLFIFSVGIILIFSTGIKIYLVNRKNVR